MPVGSHEPRATCILDVIASQKGREGCCEFCQNSRHKKGRYFTSGLTLENRLPPYCGSRLLSIR